MFFGRDSERTVLISNLRASRLTLLYAQSGAGKSSLLRAGVASRLAELAQRSFSQRGTARNIPVVFSSWRDDPTVELIGEIQEAISPFLRAVLAAGARTGPAGRGDRGRERGYGRDAAGDTRSVRGVLPLPVEGSPGPAVSPTSSLPASTGLTCA